MILGVGKEAEEQLYRNCSISSQGLVDLAHNGDHRWVELGARRPQHVRIADRPILLFLLLRFEQFPDPVFDDILSKYPSDGRHRSVLFTVEDKPTRSLWEQIRPSEKQHGIYLHDDDRRPPRPLVPLAQLMRHQHVDDKGHVQTKDVGLELLGKGGPTFIIGGEFAAVDRYHGIDTS